MPNGFVMVMETNWISTSRRVGKPLLGLVRNEKGRRSIYRKRVVDRGRGRKIDIGWGRY